MAGILDSKSRVVDFILTDEGRKQVRDGDLKIEYASFTDRDTFYEEDQDGVATDPTSRLYFESTGRYQDRIVVESNLGVVTSFSTADFNLDGAAVSTSPTVPRTASDTLILTGSEAINRSNAIITQITKNFYDQQLISNEDVFSTQQGFDLSAEEVTFEPTITSPIDLTEGENNNIPPLSSFQKPMTDRRLAHFEQFKFMPPCNVENTEYGGQLLGVYPNFNQAEVKTYDELKEILSNIPYKEIEFFPTSRDNNIIIQPFEFSNVDGKIEKLQIIDFGIFANDSGTSAGVRVFFIGKVKRLPNGSTRFLNIFTMELDV